MVFSRALEDVHMNVESRLKELIGDAGRAGCTRRARATTRWRPISGSTCATRLDGPIAALAALQLAFVRKARGACATVMPGFTHLQPAQPVTFGHHLLAYVEMLGRDRGRFADARRG